MQLVDESDAVKSNVLVIGNGMVGHHFIEQIRQRSDVLSVTVLCGEKHVAYDRVYLSSYFSGTPMAELALSTEEWYQINNVRLELDCWVDKIEPESKQVTE